MHLHKLMDDLKSYRLSSLCLQQTQFHLNFLFPAALEKKSSNLGSGVEVAPGLAAAAASSSSRGSLQSRGSGGHLSPSINSSSAAACHQGVKKEPMDHHGISSSSRSGVSRGFSPDPHSGHQYHATGGRATPPHLAHPSPYSAYPYPEAAKLPPSLSG